MADITFTGNLGRDSELAYSTSGNARLSFSVADSKSKRLPDGNWETVAEQWIRCTLWGPDAEYYSDLLLKGTRVQVFGEFYAREYDKDGQTRTSLDVTVRGLSVIPKRDNGGASRPAPRQQQRQDDPWGAGDGSGQAPF